MNSKDVYKVTRENGECVCRFYKTATCDDDCRKCTIPIEYNLAEISPLLDQLWRCVLAVQEKMLSSDREQQRIFL